MMEETVFLDDQNDPLISQKTSEQYDVAVITLDDHLRNDAINIQPVMEKKKTSVSTQQSLYLREFKTQDCRDALTALNSSSDFAVTLPSDETPIDRYHRRFRCGIYLGVFLAAAAICIMIGMMIKRHPSDQSLVHVTSAHLSNHKASPTTSNYHRTNTVTPSTTASFYLLELSSNSPTYSRGTSSAIEDDQYIETNYEEVRDYYSEKLVTYHHYEAAAIHVDTAGNYTIRSISRINTYGSIYNGTFEPLNPLQNLLLQVDDSGNGGQFQLTVYLQPRTTYILVTTTHSVNVTGQVLIIGSGPDDILFSDSRTTPTLSSTATAALIDSSSSQFTQTETSRSTTSRYSSTLNSNSGTYCRRYCLSNEEYDYYESIEMRVDYGGVYSFESVSSFDTYGSIYDTSFDPLHPQQNLLATDDDNGEGGQFRLQLSLGAEMTYILVVTTFEWNTTGDFVIIGVGPGVVSFNRITTHRTTTSTTTTAAQTTSPWSVESTYSSHWTTLSQKYCRTGCAIPGYYYEAVKVRVSRSETYSIASKSATDTYGYIYNDTFDFSNPSLNLLAQDDDSGGNGQFQLKCALQSNATYVLVATTFGAYTMGEFLLSASGPGSLIFHS